MSDLSDRFIRSHIFGDTEVACMTEVLASVFARRSIPEGCERRDVLAEHIIRLYANGT
jgi:hypothetical protein